MEYAQWSRNALLNRIKTLEAKLASLGEEIPFTENIGVPLDKDLAIAKSTRKQKYNAKNDNFPTRLVALKFFYLGWNYHGLAYQADGARTVESEIIKVLRKTNLIESEDLAAIKFSRCGRTDATVSARSQVISLLIRTVEPKREELNYVHILNANLPRDIRFYASCVDLPPNFDARFSCRGRTYRYFFHPKGYNLEAMQQAANSFVGTHDFRNFCKIDGSKQITNYQRTVLYANIVLTEDHQGLAYLELGGVAFLWNQVRSIMAVLFMIGRNLEPVNVIEQLLDVEKWPKRPAYEIASGVPLVLYDTKFDIEWEYKFAEDCELEFTDYLHKLAMAKSMYDTCMGNDPTEPIPQQQPKPEINLNGKIISQVMDGPYVPKRYIPLLQRPVRDTPEESNARWRVKKENKIRMLG